MGTFSGRKWFAGQDWLPLYLVSLLLIALLLAVVAAGQATKPGTTRVAQPIPLPSGSTAAPVPPSSGSTATPRPRVLPGGDSRVFVPGRILVAYYGTAGSGSLGVLGEAPPDAIMPRLARAASHFAIGGRKVQPVFELIVTVAHRGPGPDGAYSGDISRAKVQEYIDAAHRHGVLLLLDLQPGRADFLTVAKRWEWALADPWVGLALDPEWRVGQHQRPAQVIGSVTSAEVNVVSGWLQDLVVADDLPQKVFMLHQFRTSMIRQPDQVAAREHLAMVQHVDGFGPPASKLQTFHAVARPAQYILGFKLFYDEDKPRLSPAAVLRIKPQVRFVSFQ